MACPMPWHLVDCYRFDFTSHSVQVWWDSKPKPSSSLLCYDFYSTTCLCQFYDNTYTPAIHLTYKSTSSMTKTSRKSKTQERKQHIHTLHIFWHISFTSHVGHCWRSQKMFWSLIFRGYRPPCTHKSWKKKQPSSEIFAFNKCLKPYWSLSNVGSYQEFSGANVKVR